MDIKAQFRADVVKDIEALQEQLASISAQLEEKEKFLALFDSSFGTGGVMPSKPKATTTPKNRPGRSNLTQEAPKPRSGSSRNLKNLITYVIGSEVMNAGVIADRLLAQGLMPASQNPRQYVSFILSQNTNGNGADLFERVSGKGRGFYKNSPNGLAAAKAVDLSSPVQEDEVDVTLDNAVSPPESTIEIQA